MLSQLSQASVQQQLVPATPAPPAATQTELEGRERARPTKNKKGLSARQQQRKLVCDRRKNFWKRKADNSGEGNSERDNGNAYVPVDDIF